MITPMCAIFATPTAPPVADPQLAAVVRELVMVAQAAEATQHPLAAIASPVQAALAHVAVAALLVHRAGADVASLETALSGLDREVTSVLAGQGAQIALRMFRGVPMERRGIAPTA